MEYIPYPHEHIPSFDERFNKLLVEGRGEVEAIENIGEEKSEALNRIHLLEKNLPLALSDESKTFLTSQNNEDFNIIIIAIFRHFTGNANRSLEHIPQLSVDNLKNLLLYKKVYGYGHPDLEKRKEQNPLPTTQEILLGCYVQQLEKQTRDAVLVLRQKGYETIESGFHDHLNGSQFFHLKDKQQVVVPESLAVQLKERFDVIIETEQLNINLIPTQYKTIEQWEECLNYFAEQMPVVGEEKFSYIGSAVQFWEEMKDKFPIEQVLQTAKNPHQEELIRKLYACKDRKEVIALVKGK